MLSVQLRANNSSCPALHLAAVFDGHDGATISVQAADRLPPALEPRLSDACDEEGKSWNVTLLANALNESLLVVDAQLAEQSGGTTAVAALLQPDGRLVVAWVGDSRAYVCLADGSAHLLTRDHTPEVADERRRLLAAGGTVTRASLRGRWRLNGELAVSRALGDVGYRSSGLIPDPEVTMSSIAPGDALLLLSDGALEATSAEHLCALALGDWVHAGLSEDGFPTKSAPQHGGAAIALPGAQHDAPSKHELEPSCVANIGMQSGTVAAALADAAASYDNAAVVVCLWGDEDEVIHGAGGSYVLLEQVVPLVIAPQSCSAGALVRTDTLQQVGPRESAAWCDWLSNSDVLALPDGHEDGSTACASIRSILFSLPVGVGDDVLPEAGGFTLDGALGHGGYGQVHRARRLGDPTTRRYVIKRVPAAASPAKVYAALREIHFGEKLQGAGSLFVESIRTETTSDLWLAFLDGGTSLDALMFSGSPPPPHVGSATTAAMVTPSPWWLAQRSSSNSTALRDIMAGLFRALADIHEAGVAHRDVKGQNIVVKLPHAGSDAQASPMEVSLIDFGSAVDDVALQGDMYPGGSPSPEEETAAFAPPEARFAGTAWHGRGSVTALQAYDVWSAGVVGLQLLVTGAEDVFALPADVLQRTLRSAAAAGLHADAAAMLLAIKGLSQLCITPWGSDSKRSNASLARAQQCSETRLLELLRGKDPTGLGISPVALRMLRHLLRWDPAARVTARRALMHAFFAVGDGGMIRCADGTEVEWADECTA